MIGARDPCRAAKLGWFIIDTLCGRIVKVKCAPA